MTRNSSELPNYLPDDFDQSHGEIYLDSRAVATVLDYAKAHDIDLTDLTKFSLKLGFLIVSMASRGKFIQERDLNSDQLEPIFLTFDAMEKKDNQSWFRRRNDGGIADHITFGSGRRITMKEELMDEIRAVANSFKQEITTDQIIVAMLKIGVQMLEGEESGRKAYYLNTQQGLQKIEDIRDMVDGQNKL